MCAKFIYGVILIGDDDTDNAEYLGYSKNNRLIGLVDRVFVNGLEDLGSITGRVIPKTLKMVLDTSLLNTQQ